MEVKGFSAASPDKFYISRHEYYTMRASKSDGFEYVILLITDLGTSDGELGLVH